MIVQSIALTALIAVASAEEAADSCSKFKEYVEKNQYDCGEDYKTCKNAERCDINVCDGSSNAEKAISQGGYLYELNCGSLAEHDTLTKLCEIFDEHPDDKNSVIYKEVCHDEGDERCTATLELNDTLTNDW